MKSFIRRALCAVGLTGGIVLVGFGVAQAASADTGSGPVTSGQNGLVSGNQTGVGAQAPVNLSGNQITVIGQRNHNTSTSSATTGSSGSGSSGSPTTSGQSGIGSGNQTAVGVHAPVNATGNQVTVIGQDNTTRSVGGSSTAGSSTGSSTASGTSSGSPTTSGQSGIGSGNQSALDARAPINVSCNQVTVIGQANTSQCASASATSAPATGTPTTTGQGGILSGNQTGLGVLLPINVTGNQATVIGQGNTLSSLGGATTGGSGTSGTSADSTAPTSGPVTSGQSGGGSGNQTGLGVLAPIDITGNQATVIGQDNTLTSLGGATTGGSSTSGSTGTTSGPVTSGQSGFGSGNQTGLAVLAPIAATGNQATVIGQDNTLTSTGGSTTGSGGTSTGETTTGAGGIGSGNQTPVVVQAPVDTSGNQVTVIGQGNTATSTSTSSTGTPGGSTGGIVSPPTSGVTPPTGGTATTVSQPHGAATPTTGVLPNTGLGAGLPWLAGLALLLLGLGTALARRAAAPAGVRAG